MRLSTLLLGASLLTPALAHAELVITAAGGSTGDVVAFEQTFNNVTTLTGDTNKGANTVDFLTLASDGLTTTPTNQLIGTDGKGQADVVCTSGCVPDGTGGLNGHLLNGLEIKLTAGIGATTEIFNLDFGTGTVAIVAEDNFGNTFTQVLTPGSNFFRIDAVAGTNEAITDTKIFESAADSTGNFGWNDLKQPRILACTIGVDCLVAPPVPEPSSIALMGVGLLGLGSIARRRRA